MRKLSTYASAVTPELRVKSNGTLKKAIKALKKHDRAGARAGGGGGGAGGEGRGTKRKRASGDGAAVKKGGAKRVAFGTAFRISTTRPLKEQVGALVLRLCVCVCLCMCVCAYVCVCVLLEVGVYARVFVQSVRV